MWFHSHVMWFWESSYSQLIWFQNADVFGQDRLCSQFATCSRSNPEESATRSIGLLVGSSYDLGTVRRANNACPDTDALDLPDVRIYLHDVTDFNRTFKKQNQAGDEIVNHVL